MPGSNKFPGDLTDGETPDPIPNSEAKLVRPMVVLTGESRSSPGFMRPVSLLTGLAFFEHGAN